VKEVLLRDSVGRRDPDAVLAFAEGATTTVAIVDDRAGFADPGAKRLLSDGVNMSSTNWNAKRYMKFLAHLPLLLHPDPRSVVVVGLGTGMTAGAATLHPGVEEVVTAELAPEVVRGARHFADANHGVLDRAKHRVVVADGRHFLRYGAALYDVILAEPPPPRSSATINIYSREYYEACRDALRPGGFALQWMPLHSQGDQELRAKLRTFIEVFPQATLWLPSGEEAIVLGVATAGGASPLPIDGDLVRARMSDPAITTALAEIGLATPADLLACYWLGPEGLARYTRDLPVITDRHPYTQHYIDHPRLLDFFDLQRLLSLREPPPPRLAATATSPEALAVATEALGEFIRGQALDQPSLVLEALRAKPTNHYYQQLCVTTPEQEQALLGEIEQRPGDSELWLNRVRLAARRGAFEESMRELARAITGSPEWPPARILAGEIALGAGEPARGLELVDPAFPERRRPSQATSRPSDPRLATIERLLEAAVETQEHPEDLKAGFNLVNLAIAAEEYGLARREGARLLAIAPEHPLAIGALACALDESGHPGRTAPLYDRLASALPDDEAISRARARAHFYAGRAASAERLLAVVVKQNPSDWMAHRLRAEASRELGRYGEAAAAIAPLSGSPDRADRLLARERTRAYRLMARLAADRGPAASR
jgi:tetratricopeptide (TPR) repeat protein